MNIHICILKCTQRLHCFQKTKVDSSLSGAAVTRFWGLVGGKGWGFSVDFLLLTLPQIVFRRPALSGMTLSLFQLHSVAETKGGGSSGRISDIAGRGSTSPKRD